MVADAFGAVYQSVLVTWYWTDKIPATVSQLLKQLYASQIY